METRRDKPCPHLAPLQPEGPEVDTTWKGSRTRVLINVYHENKFSEKNVVFRVVMAQSYGMPGRILKIQGSHE